MEMINIQLLQVWGNNIRVCATISIKMTKWFSISKEILRPLFQKNLIITASLHNQKKKKQTNKPLHCIVRRIRLWQSQVDPRLKFEILVFFFFIFLGTQENLSFNEKAKICQISLGYFMIVGLFFGPLLGYFSYF